MSKYFYAHTIKDLAAAYPKGWKSYFHGIIGYDEPLSKRTMKKYYLKEIKVLDDLPEHYKKTFDTLSAIEYSTAEQALKTFKTNFVEGK